MEPKSQVPVGKSSRSTWSRALEVQGTLTTTLNGKTYRNRAVETSPPIDAPMTNWRRNSDHDCEPVQTDQPLSPLGRADLSDVHWRMFDGSPCDSSDDAAGSESWRLHVNAPTRR